MAEAIDPRLTEPRTSLLRSTLITLGIPVPMLMALIDSAALQACVGKPPDVRIYALYALFVAQTALLGVLVGSQLRRQVWWWGILAWGILLVDLQVFAIASVDRWSPANTVGFGFASSQIGATVCFAILGTPAWHFRLPIAGVSLGLATYFAFALQASDAWYQILFMQSVATGIVCLFLRSFAFRIRRSDQLVNPDNKRLQFSIRHLFFWTTGVGIFVGIVRLVPWKSMLALEVLTDHLTDLLIFVPLLTLVSMLALWGSLGREAWFSRYPVLAMMLPGIGVALGFYVIVSQQRSRWNPLFPVWETRQVFELGIVWTTLAGALLLGLLLVFRATGYRLQRSTNP